MRNLQKFYTVVFIAIFLVFSSLPVYAAASWTNSGNMSIARRSITATKLSSGKVLATGGRSSCAYNQSQLYNPSTKTWSNTGAMSIARTDHTANLVTISGGGERVLVVGGIGTCVASGTSSAELYNESNGSWSGAASMTDTRYSHTATTLNDGTIIVVGGSNNSGTARSSVELYDPVGNNWSTEASLNVARKQHASTLLNDGKVFVTGGITSTGSATATAEIYDPSSNTWSYARSMTNARSGHTSTLLPNGNVLVVAGGTGNTLMTAEVYDPSNDSWTSTPNLSYKHSGSTATLVTLTDTSQNVLVAGNGTGSSTNWDKAELYDYNNNLWNVTASLNTGRSMHAAALLDDGTVLVAGGLASTGDTATTEYYTAP